MSNFRLCRHLGQELHANNHNKQTYRDNDEEGEGEPAHDHGAGSNTTLDNAVSEILGYNRGGDGSCMLPQNGDQNEDGGDEDNGEGHLGDRSGGEWLDGAF